MRMDSAEARTSGRKTSANRKAPLKPKNGLNGPPASEIECFLLLRLQRMFQSPLRAFSAPSPWNRWDVKVETVRRAKRKGEQRAQSQRTGKL